MIGRFEWFPAFHAREPSSSMDSPTCMEGYQASARFREALEQKPEHERYTVGYSTCEWSRLFSWRSWRLRPDHGQDTNPAAAPTPSGSDPSKHRCYCIHDALDVSRETTHEEDAPDLRCTIRPRTLSTPSQYRGPRQVERHTG